MNEFVHRLNYRNMLVLLHHILGPLIKLTFTKKILLFFLKFIIPDKFCEFTIDNQKFIANPYIMPQWRSYVTDGTLPEEKMLLTFSYFCKDSTVVFDIGSHWGIYALFASKNIKPDGKVFAVEANRCNFKILLKNIEINNINNIIPLNFALGDKNQHQKLYEGEIKNSGSYCLNPVSSSKSKHYEVVEVRRFDDIAEPFSQIEVVKVDIEGAEGCFIDGAIKSLKNGKIKSIFMEIHNNLSSFNYRHKDIVRKIYSYGFMVYFFENGSNNLKRFSFHNATIKPPYNIVAVLKGCDLEKRLAYHERI